MGYTNYEKVSLSNALISALGDTRNGEGITDKKHTIKIFQLERGAFDSNFSVEFMLPIYNTLEVTETVDFSNVNEALKSATKEVVNKDVFDIQLTAKDSRAVENNQVTLPLTNDNNASFTRTSPDGTKTQTLQSYVEKEHQETVTNANGDSVPVTAYYQWTDYSSQASGEGVGVPTDDGHIYMQYDQKAKFINQFSYNGSGSGSFAQIAFEQKDNIRRYGTLNNRNTGMLETKTTTAIPELIGLSDNSRKVSDYYNTAYVARDIHDSANIRTMLQSDTLIDDRGSVYFANITQNNESTTNSLNTDIYSTDNNIEVRIDLTNQVKVGSVIVAKTVSDRSDTDENKLYKFRLEYSQLFGDTDSTDVWKVARLAGGVRQTRRNIANIISYTDVTDASERDITYDSRGFFTLKKDQAAKFTGIPVGTKYRVVELREDGDNFSLSDIGNESITPGLGNSVLEVHSGFVKETDESGNDVLVASDTVGQNVTSTGFDNDKVTGLKVDNTYERIPILYRYQDRGTANGVVPKIEDHYTYFVEYIKSNYRNVLNSDNLLEDLFNRRDPELTDTGKERIASNAPALSNILKDYELKQKSSSDSSSSDTVQYEDYTMKLVKLDIHEESTGSLIPPYHRYYYTIPESELTDNLVYNESNQTTIRIQQQGIDYTTEVSYEGLDDTLKENLIENAFEDTRTLGLFGQKNKFIILVTYTPKTKTYDVNYQSYAVPDDSLIGTTTVTAGTVSKEYNENTGWLKAPRYLIDDSGNVAGIFAYWKREAKIGSDETSLTTDKIVSTNYSYN